MFSCQFKADLITFFSFLIVIESFNRTINHANCMDNANIFYLLSSYDQ